jgi:hypothetical protein
VKSPVLMLLTMHVRAMMGSALVLATNQAVMLYLAIDVI